MTKNVGANWYTCVHSHGCLRAHTNDAEASRFLRTYTTTTLTMAQRMHDTEESHEVMDLLIC